MNTQLERELALLIVESLLLEDVDADEIGAQTPLFGDGLGLDSIDALELAIAIERRFGVKIEPSAEEAPKIFQSIRSIARHVSDRRPSVP